MAQPFFAHPYLSGHHAPVRFEADAPDLIIHGEVPADLEGLLYRNGPEPLHPPREGEYHRFDGDGMVYTFPVADGRVALRNRWVRTEKFELEKAASKRLFGLLGNPMIADPSVQGKRYNTANTKVILQGEHDYDGTITTTFRAHPKIDHTTGELRKAEIIAMPQIPFRVPSGFHCNFCAADSAL